jgi:hypothetical protein
MENYFYENKTILFCFFPLPGFTSETSPLHLWRGVGGEENNFVFPSLPAHAGRGGTRKHHPIFHNLPPKKDCCKLLPSLPQVRDGEGARKHHPIFHNLLPKKDCCKLLPSPLIFLSPVSQVKPPLSTCGEGLGERKINFVFTPPSRACGTGGGRGRGNLFRSFKILFSSKKSKTHVSL